MSLHYNEADSYLYFNGTEIIKFKATYSEICSNSIEFRKYFKRLVNRQYGENVYDFNVDYDAIAVDDVSDIDNYLMKRMP